MLRVLVWGHSVGLVIAIGWLTATGGRLSGGDLLVGAAAGTFGLGGLYSLYLGLARGRAAVVAPTAAVVGAVLPVVAGVVLGDRPGPVAWAGVAAAVPAIALVSRVEGLTRRSGGLTHGLVAGAFFGAFFVVFAQASPDSGLWPLLGSRAVSTALLWVVVATLRRELAPLPRGPTGAAVVGVGVLDLVANGAYLGATRSGSLVVVAVVASLFPAVTVLAARLVHHELLSMSQGVGLALGVVAVALLSIA